MLVWRRRVGGLLAVDVALAACLVAGAAVTVAEHTWSARSGVALVVSCAGAALVAARTRAPRAAALGFAVAMVVLAVLRPPGGTPLWAFIALLILAFSVGAQLAPRQAAYTAAALVAAGVLFHARLDATNAVEAIVSPLVIVGLPAAAGAILYRSREQTQRLTILTRELAEQREQVQAAAIQSERTRIARELHDVIAHTVGVMVVQAGAAERLLAADHPARSSVHSIRSTGKEAMGELRRVVGLLRAVSDEPPEPQPGLGELLTLIDTARASGPIEADLATDIDLPAGAALAVYRTVQEALTNARRHAPGSTIRVCVRVQGDRLLASVDNDASSERPTATTTGSGFGLVGLAERAELYGGTCQARPLPDGGWRVSLSLPLTRNDDAATGT